MYKENAFAKNIQGTLASYYRISKSGTMSIWTTMSGRKNIEMKYLTLELEWTTGAFHLSLYPEYNLSSRDDVTQD